MVLSADLPDVWYLPAISSCGSVAHSFLAVLAEILTVFSYYRAGKFARGRHAN